MSVRSLITEPVDGKRKNSPVSAVAASTRWPDFRESGKRRPVKIMAYAGVACFFVLYFFRPEDFVPGLGAVPLAKIAGIFAASALAGSILSGRAKFTLETKLLLALFVYFCIAIIGSIWVGGSYDVIVNGFLKNMIAVLAAAFAITTLARLRRMIVIQTSAMLVMTVLALGQGRQFGRMFGAGNMFSDPNDFALNLCIILPFCVALMLTSRSPTAKLFWIAGSGLALVGIVSTYSRGGFLALIALTIAMARQYKVKFKTFILFLAVAGSLWFIAILAVGSSSYFARLTTIADPQSDTTGSAEIRQDILQRSLQVTLQHPILGVGPGQFPLVSGSWHVTHNTYTQLSSEAGIPALLIFIALAVRSFKNLALVHNSRGTDEIWQFSSALHSALAGYLVGAFFLSTAYWLIPYLLFIYTVVLRKMAGADAAEEGRLLAA